MQKFYLKYKDRWWTLPLFALFSWLISKLFDFLAQAILKIDASLYISSVVSLLHYKVSLLAVILGVISAASVYRVVQQFKVKKRRLKVIKALYGINSSWVDITNELNNAVSENKLVIVLSNNIAGDPIYGHQKVCDITYKYDGKEFTTRFIEGQTITLP